jgi:hypothetical protein
MAGFVPGTTNLPQNVALLSLGQYIDQGEIVVKSRYKYLKLNKSTVHEAAHEKSNKDNFYNFLSRSMMNLVKHPN